MARLRLDLDRAVHCPDPLAYDVQPDAAARDLVDGVARRESRQQYQARDLRFTQRLLFRDQAAFDRAPLNLQHIQSASIVPATQHDLLSLACEAEQNASGSWLANRGSHIRRFQAMIHG